SSLPQGAPGHMALAIPPCKSPPILATAVRRANGCERAPPGSPRGVAMRHLATKKGDKKRATKKAQKSHEKKPGRGCPARALRLGRPRGSAPPARSLAPEMGDAGVAASARALQRLFDGLVGLFGEFGVHAADLRHLMHVAVVGALGKAALDLDRLLERF